MRLQTRDEYPEIYNCGLMSLAMVLDMDPVTVRELLPDPQSNLYGQPRGFTYADAQRVAMCSGRIFGMIEVDPLVNVNGEGRPLIHDATQLAKFQFFINTIQGYRGILATESHSMAWDGSKIYDPAGAGRVLDIRTLEGLSIKEAWLLAKLT